MLAPQFLSQLNNFIDAVNAGGKHISRECREALVLLIDDFDKFGKFFTWLDTKLVGETLTVDVDDMLLAAVKISKGLM